MTLTPEEALEQAALAGIHQFRIPTPFAVGRVNCYLIEDEPLTLVDTGPNSGKALDELQGHLAERGHSIDDLELVIVTHQHIDHLGLVEIIAEHSGAEVAAIGGFPVPANAEAVADSRCVLLPREPFRRALEEDHQLCLQMIAGFSYWVQHLVGLMGDVVLRDAVGRLARFLLNSDADATGRVELPSLKRHLASHLNLTSETFSRTLRRLVDAGVIAHGESNLVQIVNREKLRLIAEGLSPKV